MSADPRAAGGGEQEAAGPPGRGQRPDSHSQVAHRGHPAEHNILHPGADGRSQHATRHRGVRWRGHRGMGGGEGGECIHPGADGRSQHAA